jgi:hypothetical protein
MKAIGRALSWLGVVVFGISVVGTLIAKLSGSYLGDNFSWVIQEGIQSALFAVSLWGVIRLRRRKSKEPEAPSAPSRRGLRVTHVIQGVIILAIVGILGAIGMTHMNDRSVKEHFIDAFRAGESAARFSQAFYVKSGRWPTQAEFSQQSFDTNPNTRGPVAVRGSQSISIADNGTITISMTGHAEINDKLIRLKPTVLQQDVSWTCASDYEQRGFPEFLTRRCADRFPRE